MVRAEPPGDTGGLPRAVSWSGPLTQRGAGRAVKWSGPESADRSPRRHTEAGAERESTGQ
ncbi:hypothetical protein STTU_6432 [Streptomyces sp. Tu6071]|nr:hypothetical protein STTU_6432 [Streptomyces sp. Tu6071]